MLLIIESLRNNAATMKALPGFKKTLLAPLLSLALIPCTAAQAALEGALESVTCDLIKGWAWNNAAPTKRVKVHVYDIIGTKSTLLVTLTAQTFRPDLLATGKGDGKVGFSLLLPASIRNAAQHTLSVRFADTVTELANSPKTTVSACYGKLNDTGWQGCGDNLSNNLACPVANFKGQDGDYGRDALARGGKLRKTGKGNAGFDFTKIANDGSKLPATAALGAGAKDWACTLDNVTGLLWEVKTADGGLRDQDNLYSWYNPNNTVNGGSAGYQNGGYCTGDISCDTQGYVQAVNKAKLCGKSYWRLPKKSELLSIVDYSTYSPAIDSDYFPNTVSSMFYWSSSPSPDNFNETGAWVVSFYSGDSIDGAKSNIDVIRLVFGRQ